MGTIRAEELSWEEIRGEKVAFVDDGISKVEMLRDMPILLRVGTYIVRPNEKNLNFREGFRYYPVLLGDLEGGSKERRDFPDIVRIMAELLGGLSVLECDKDLDILMFQGPLMYLMTNYAGHTPFTEKDIDLLLNNYAGNMASSDRLGIKKDFFSEAEDLYKIMLNRNAYVWIDRKYFEPLTR